MKKKERGIPSGHTVMHAHSDCHLKGIDSWRYVPENMQKSAVMDRLRKNGCRVTKQREVLIDIILQGECISCKEIYILAAKIDPRIGLATVYRMIRALEEVGVLRRKNIYRIYSHEYIEPEKYLVKLENDDVLELNQKTFRQIVERGMRANGQSGGKKVKQVLIKTV